MESRLVDITDDSLPDVSRCYSYTSMGDGELTLCILYTLYTCLACCKAYFSKLAMRWSISSSFVYAYGLSGGGDSVLTVGESNITGDCLTAAIVLRDLLKRVFF